VAKGTQVEVTIDDDAPAAAAAATSTPDEGDTDDAVVTEESSDEDSLESSLENIKKTTCWNHLTQKS